MMLPNHPVLLLPVAEGTSRTNTKVSVHAGDAAAQDGRQLVCCSFSPWPHYARAGYQTQSGSKHQEGCLIDKCALMKVCV